MINRRDALKAIAGTALIPFVGITPAVAAPVAPALQLVHYDVIASWVDKGTTIHCHSQHALNPKYFSDPFGAIFKGVAMMHPEATKISIRRDGSAFVVNATKDQHSVHLDQDTWNLRSCSAYIGTLK